LAAASWRRCWRCRGIGPQHRRAASSAPPTTAVFDPPMATLATGAGRDLTASPRPPQRAAGRGSGNFSDSTARPAAAPGVQPGPDGPCGATVCTPRQTRLRPLPLAGHCAAYACRRSRCLPVKGDATRPLPFQVIGVGVVLDAAAGWLIDQRLDVGLLRRAVGSSPAARQASRRSDHRHDRAGAGGRSWGSRLEVGEEADPLGAQSQPKRLRFHPSISPLGAPADSPPV